MLNTLNVLTKFRGPLLQSLPVNRNAKRSGLGEAGDSHPARFLALAEYYLLVHSVLRPPLAHSPLEGAFYRGVQLRVQPRYLPPQSHRADIGNRFEYGSDLGIKNAFQAS